MRRDGRRDAWLLVPAVVSPATLNTTPLHGARVAASGPRLGNDDEHENNGRRRDPRDVAERTATRVRALRSALARALRALAAEYCAAAADAAVARAAAGLGDHHAGQEGGGGQGATAMSPNEIVPAPFEIDEALSSLICHPTILE